MINCYRIIFFLVILFGSVSLAFSVDGERMPPLKMDILMKVKQGNAGDVIFKHETHTAVLECADCHPAIFVPAKGTNRVTMDEMRRGYGCGACHGEKSFGLDDCKKCHMR